MVGGERWLEMGDMEGDGETEGDGRGDLTKGDGAI